MSLPLFDEPEAPVLPLPADGITVGSARYVDLWEGFSQGASGAPVYGRPGPDYLAAHRVGALFKPLECVTVKRRRA